jgi:integrase
VGCGRTLGHEDVLRFARGATHTWTLHTLRHYAASWMIGNQPGDLHMDPVDVAHFLGHYNATYTIAQYVGVRGNVVERMAEATSRAAANRRP